jgi:two-component system nitrate/nitrite response regulator NarL
VHGHASENRKVSVFVADANVLNGELIVGALKRCGDRFAVVDCSSNYADAIQALEKFNPQVAVISTDLQDGSLSGFRVLHHLRAINSPTLVIMLMDGSDRELVIDSFRGGARGVFCRGESVKSLSKCICAVKNGQLWMNNEQMSYLLDLVRRVKPLQLSNIRDAKHLTKREAEVVRFVAEGMKNSEIGTALGVSEHTVRNYLYRIFEKLGLSSRVELVLHALTEEQNSPPSQVPPIHRLAN